MDVRLTRSALALALLCPAVSSADVFINELHYDNVGTDAGEMVEVVATGGETLSQYSLYFYNGNGGALSTSTSPNPQTLGAGAAVTCGATVRIATLFPNQIENGGPDGIALVGPGGTVVQFLSYEGTFQATGGPAAGMTSVDIGVAESASAAVGTSLQLRGKNGSAYADFTWAGSATQTAGSCNTAQTFGAAVDNAPFVQNTTPADGDSDVAIGTTIQIEFSESVTVDDPSGIVLDCGGGSLPFTHQLTGGNTLVLDPTAPLPHGALCDVDIAADTVLDTDGTPNPMAAGYAFNFETEVDDPPVLLSSVPANGANSFPANGNLSLQFSEAVNVSGNWFSIACPVSGNRAVANTVVSGGPATYSINPNADFTAGETCTLTLVPANIVDTDGTPDAYTGPTTITFTAATPPPNPPPTVSSTIPLDGATNFPSAGDLGVTFSEPVTLSAGAFALTCSQTTDIVLVHPSSGTAFTIDTGAALFAGETCTFTIDADGVTDAQGAHPTADTAIDFTVSESSTSAYYASVNTSSPAQLRCTLHEIIDGHTAYPYTSSSTDTWDILNLADQDPTDNTAILDIYRNATYTKISGGTGVYNREHTWPNSLGFPGGSAGAYTDTHMLYASDSGYNSSRSNSPYDNCPGCNSQATLANHGAGGAGDPNYYNSSTYQVWSGRKGDAARAIFYMAIRYEGDGGEPQLELTDNRSLITGRTSTGPSNPAYMGILTTLLQWHQADPPDEKELLRNEVVYGFQGNRNPFIDHPEWATAALFTSTRPAQCQPGTGNQPPTVSDKTYAATEDTLLTVAAPGVLVGANDPEGATLTAQLVGNVQNGTLSLASNGGFTYTGNANRCGTDQFTFRASDGAVGSATAIATINIACVNDAPVANAATFGIAENSAVGTFVGDVVATDPDGDTLSYTIETGNTGGAFAIDADGEITVASMAALDFETTPQFVLGVRVRDDETPVPASVVAQVTINLTNIFEAAIANDDVAQVDEDAVAAALGVRVNDDAGEDGLVVVSGVGAPQHGTATFDAGDVYYTPTANYCGSDSVSYTLQGGDTANVAITVTCINDAPTIAGATFQLAENSAAGTLVGTVAADDVDGDTLTFGIVAGNGAGAFAIDADGRITVADAAPLDFETSPQFVLTVRVTDDATPTASAEAQVTIDLTDIDEPAVANDDIVTVTEDDLAYALGVTANDVAGDEGIVVIAAGTAQHGSVFFDASNVYYTPNADYCGTDSVSYTLLGGSSATVAITVTCVADAPVIVAPLADRSAVEGIAIVAFSVADGFDDVDVGDTLSFTATGLPDGLTLDTATGLVSGSPLVGTADGSPYTVVVTASDGSASVSQDFVYTITPDEPLPIAIFASGFED